MASLQNYLSCNDSPNDYYLFSIMLNIPSCKKMTNKTWPKPYVIGKFNNITD